MITTILMTALVSVISTLVLGYFIWSGFRVHKLNKLAVGNRNFNIGTEESIRMLRSYLDEQLNDISRSQEEQYNNIMSVFDEQYDVLNTKIIYNDNEMSRQLDKRFDTSYRRIDEVDVFVHNLDKTINEERERLKK